MSNVNNEGQLKFLSSVGGVSSSGGSRASGGNANDWIRAMSEAWGQTLDAKANQIVELSANLGNGAGMPSETARLTAASQEMSYLAQSAATSVNAASEAVSTIARKQ